MNDLKEAKGAAVAAVEGAKAEVTGSAEPVAAGAGAAAQANVEAPLSQAKSALEAAAQAKVAGLEQGREAALEEVAAGAEGAGLEQGREAAGAVEQVGEKKASLEASGEKGATTIEAQANEEENKRIIEGSLIAAVATMSAATKIAERKGEETDTTHLQGNGLVAELIGSPVPGATTVKPPVQDTRIKSLFLDNLHLFFGDIHLKPIKEFINPSHQLNQHLDMSTMNGLDRENYEHGRLLTLLKNMFFRESEGVISKERVFKGGGITIDQLKNKIKKGISLIVPKS